jgi:hypothetical protein
MMNEDRINAKIMLQWLTSNESELRQKFDSSESKDLSEVVKQSEKLIDLANVSLAEVIEYQSSKLGAEWGQILSNVKAIMAEESKKIKASLEKELTR